MNITNWGFVGSLPKSRYPMADVPSAQYPAGSGIEYLYAVAAARERGKHATLVFRLEDPDRAATALSAAGVKLVSSAELFARAGA